MTSDSSCPIAMASAPPHGEELGVKPSASQVDACATSAAAEMDRPPDTAPRVLRRSVRWLRYLQARVGAPRARSSMPCSQSDTSAEAEAASTQASPACVGRRRRRSRWAYSGRGTRCATRVRGARARSRSVQDRARRPGHTRGAGASGPSPDPQPRASPRSRPLRSAVAKCSCAIEADPRAQRSPRSRRKGTMISRSVPSSP